VGWKGALAQAELHCDSLLLAPRSLAVAEALPLSKRANLFLQKAKDGMRGQHKPWHCLWGFHGVRSLRATLVSSSVVNKSCPGLTVHSVGAESVAFLGWHDRF